MINFLSIQKVFSVKHNHSHCRWQSIIWPNSALQFASTISVGNSHAWQNYSHSQSKLVRISVKHCYEALESDSSNSPKTGNNIKSEIYENQERLHICYKVKLPIPTSFFGFVFAFFPAAPAPSAADTQNSKCCFKFPDRSLHSHFKDKCLQ